MLLLRSSILAVFIAAAAVAGEADALTIDAGIRARHMPFGTVIDPMYASATSDQLVGYTRCGDSALWTGAYLAAEAFRYNVTRSAAALDNVRAALAGLKSLADVTGDNRLARCLVPADSRFAAGIAAEESNNTVYSSGIWLWVDNTSRDQVVGAMFGLGVAFDLVDDPAVKAGVNDLVTRLTGYISRHRWSPNDDPASTFELRPEALQMMLDVARHVNPANQISGPFFRLPIQTAVAVDTLSTGSYYKFNLDYMSFFHLVRLEDSDDNRSAYGVVRRYTAGHGNAFFNLVDRALTAPDAVRDGETRALLEQWLQRPRRDVFVDQTKNVAVCGGEACRPLPVAARVTTDFLWQRSPFQLSGGGSGRIESAGIDYILPYWMARYYGVIVANTVQSAAAVTNAVAPASLASMYGNELVAAGAPARLSVTDSAGARREALVLYSSASQINFVVPDGTAAGMATFGVNGGATATTTVRAVAPALFSMDGTGRGVAAATAVTTQAADPAVQSPVPVFQCTAGGCVAVPIRVGIDAPVYVTFYGTGIRSRSSLGAVQATINGVAAPVLYAGPAPGFAGLDQVNVGLPVALAGSGESKVVVTADGQASNTVVISLR